jgi:hypothetical protein
VAILAISISWIPILNNISPIFSVLALILAIPAFIKARKGASGKGLTIASVILSVLAFVLVLGTQAMFSNAIDDIGESVEQSMEQADNSLSVTLGEPSTDSTGWVTVPLTVSNAGPEDLSGGSVTVQASDGGTVVGEALVSIPRLKVGQTAAETADFFEALPSGATFEVVDKDGYTFG